MNYVVLTGKDEGIGYFLRTALEPIGQTVWLSRGSPISVQLAEQLSEHDGSPIVAVLDLGGEPLERWKTPIEHFMATNQLGKNQLPDGSSIVAVSEVENDQCSKYTQQLSGIQANLLLTHHGELLSLARQNVTASLITPTFIASTVAKLVGTMATEIFDHRIKQGFEKIEDPKLRQFAQNQVDKQRAYLEQSKLKLLKSVANGPSLVDRFLGRFF
jgi:hypothetical protein